MEKTQLASNISNYEDQVVSLEMERIGDTISSLPTEDGWRTLKPLCLYQGFWCFPYYAESIILGQKYYKAEPSDIFVCSAPKSGTTWLKALTFSIVTRTRFNSSSNPLLFQSPHTCMPSFHRSFSKKLDIREPGLPLIASHTPYASLPKSVKDSDCKIVYICRDPRDAFVSLFHYIAKVRPKENEPISLEEAFELYCEGKSLFGPFWDNILGYWRASVERPRKVLFLKYEDMMKDTTLNVKKLAEFVGYPFSLEEEQQGMVQKIIEMCSFEFMSNLEVNKNGISRLATNVENNVFFRKGKVGDWKNHLTPEMANRLDNIIEQKLIGSGLTFNP
ncbi:hypothetical protein SLEP1_g5003 [Rubroshorea leprosula]|uniref:Sulfotransferase n=1 Tax=Rubroshorea leprosula TaxID=152421 RepID=A0AAV5HZF7_9ROSI|nr:hypothetical protein SLEP1_g5003 [Rubroshorea leprosula]